MLQHPIEAKCGWGVRRYPAAARAASSVLRLSPRPNNQAPPSHRKPLSTPKLLTKCLRNYWARTGPSAALLPPCCASIAA